VAFEPLDSLEESSAFDVAAGVNALPERRGSRNLSHRQEAYVDIYLDDNPVADFEATTKTVEQVLREVQARCQQEGRIVVAFRCDGVEVLANDMANALAKPAAEVARLEVYTGTQVQLVAEAMDQAARALEAADQERHRVASLLIEGRVSEGVELLGECVAVLQQIHEAVGKSLDMLDVDAATMEIGGRSIAETFERPKDMLVQIKEALLSKDHVLLADILQYEFDDVAAQWRLVVNDIRRYALDREDE
jgi:hypothetical protein